MKKARKNSYRLAMLAGLGLFGTQAIADPINFDPDGLGPVGSLNVATFDWVPGNALSIGGNQAIKTFLESPTAGFSIGGITGGTQTPFDLVYHARLGVMLSPGGVNITPVALDVPGGFEITVVAKFQEVVQAISFPDPMNLSKVNATFAQAPVQTNNYFEVYFDNNPLTKANDLQGTGFNDGKLIAKGVVNVISSAINITDNPSPLNPNLDQFGSGGSGPAPAGQDNYPGIDTVKAGGNTELNAVANITFVDKNFFVDQPTALSFVLFNTNLALPFGQIDPSARFVMGENVTGLGTAGPASALAGAGVSDALGAGLTNNPASPFFIGSRNGDVISTGYTNAGLGLIIPGGLAGPSFQLQADANNTFLQTPGVVPEPATAVLGLMALAGLAARRRQNA